MGNLKTNTFIAEKIKEIYAITTELEMMYPGRHFTPDGHMVGSIGEVLAAENYNLQLLPASFKTHDATTTDGRLVQIKATQGKQIAISSEPDYIIVVRILRDGCLEEYYNGKGSPVWNAAGSMQKNGQRSISLSKLVKLNKEQDDCDRIPSAHDKINE